SLTGTELFYKGDLIKPAKELKYRIKNELGLDTTIGLGENRMIAKMASKSAKPDGFRVINRCEIDEFICDLPVDSLPGVGRKTAAIFRKFNINTIKEIRQLSIDHLQQLFGQNGVAIYERCRGNDSHVICNREIPRTISRETTFHNDTINRNEIEGMICYLTERAMNTLRELKLMTKTVKLKIKYADFVEDVMSKTLWEHTNIDTDVIELLMGTLKIIYKRRVSLRQVGVTLSNLRIETGRQQLQLFDVDNKRIKKLKLYRAIDSIRNKYGFAAIITGESFNNSRRLKHDRYGYILRTPSLTK
ncbi:MAG: DNA polymerase Y family protein, partial [Candidatus Anammoxibacter sp.]